MAKQLTPWTKHLMAYKHAHPGKTLSQCMKLASKTYSKK
jgi:hypothetical protein